MRFFSRRREQALDEEIAGHLKMAAADRREAGISARDAELAARREFGNVTLTKEITRDMWGWSWLDRIGQDVRYALRLFRRNPGLTISAVVTLAVGIGANTAMFAAARGILLRPLPYAEPDRLVMVWQRRQDPLAPARGIASPRYALEWRSLSDVFSGFAVLESWKTNLAPRVDISGEGTSERLRGSYVSPNFFELLGIRAALGRTFSSDFESDNPADSVILSDALWRRRFAADPGIIGRTVDLAAGRGRERRVRTFVVVGVLPARFHFTYPEETEIWLQRTWAEVERETPAAMMYHVIARLKPAVTVEHGQANLDAVHTAIAVDGAMPDSFRTSAGRATAWLEPMHDFAVGQTRPALLLVTVVTAFLLTVSCVSVASLQLARSVDRARELAVRSALGATPRRIASQLFVEGLVLASVGGVTGLLAAWLLQPVLLATLPATYPRVGEIAIDRAAIAWSALLASIAAIAAGLAPVWCGVIRNLSGELKHGGQTIVANVRTMRWRRLLVAGQVAIVVVLLVGGGLLLQSLWKLHRVNLGFDGRDVLTMEMRLLSPKYFDLEALRAFQDELLRRVRAIPRVTHASITSSVPFRGTDWFWRIRTSGGGVTVNARDVDREYFALMRIRLVAGRLFDSRDTATSPSVAIISESLANLLFPGSSAVGRTLESAGGDRTPEIVGVVADVRHERIDAPPGVAVYVPKAQAPSELICLLVRAGPSADGFAAAVRAAVHSIDPYQPVEGITTLDRIVSASVADRRFYVMSTLAFGAIALLLAIVGLYGVVSSGVTQRERELGLRLVLGASRNRVLHMVLRQALLPVAAGLAAGLVAAFWASRLLQRFLFEVRPTDAGTYAAVAALIVVIALAACIVPGQRALRVNLADTLRME
jgi:putative ABC transport system permease protein